MPLSGPQIAIAATALAVSASFPSIWALFLLRKTQLLLQVKQAELYSLSKACKSFSGSEIINNSLRRVSVIHC